MGCFSSDYQGSLIVLWQRVILEIWDLLFLLFTFDLTTIRLGRWIMAWLMIMRTLIFWISSVNTHDRNHSSRCWTFGKKFNICNALELVSTDAEISIFRQRIVRTRMYYSLPKYIHCTTDLSIRVKWWQGAEIVFVNKNDDFDVWFPGCLTHTRRTRVVGSVDAIPPGDSQYWPPHRWLQLFNFLLQIWTNFNFQLNSMTAHLALVNRYWNPNNLTLLI